MFNGPRRSGDRGRGDPGGPGGPGGPAMPSPTLWAECYSALCTRLMPQPLLAVLV